MICQSAGLDQCAGLALEDGKLLSDEQHMDCLVIREDTKYSIAVSGVQPKERMKLPRLILSKQKNPHEEESITL